MQRERLEPQNDERGADDSRSEHYFRRDKRLIPAHREPGQLRLHKIRLVHDLREIIAGLDGLTESEAVGIEVGRVACIAAGVATANSILFINTRLPRISTHLDLGDDETLGSVRKLSNQLLIE